MLQWLDGPREYPQPDWPLQAAGEDLGACGVPPVPTQRLVNEVMGFGAAAQLCRSIQENKMNEVRPAESLGSIPAELLGQTLPPDFAEDKVCLSSLSWFVVETDSLQCPIQ